MKSSEIITADLEAKGTDPQEALQLINTALKSNKAILLQENDSVLFLLRISKGDVELHLFTVDSPLKMAKSIIGFVKKIKASDIQRVYGKADNPQIVQMLKNLDVPVTDSDNPKYNWMATV